MKSSHFASDLHYSGSTGELQDAVPLPNLDYRSSDATHQQQLANYGCILFFNMQNHQDDQDVQPLSAILRKTSVVSGPHSVPTD